MSLPCQLLLGPSGSPTGFQQTISHWENNDSQPNVEMLLKLMQVLELEAGELLSVEE